MSTPVSPPLHHTVNSDSTSNSKVQHAAGHRVKVGALHLPAAQSISLPSELKHELMFFPNSSAPTFSGYFTIDIKSRDILINNLTLQFNMGTATGSSMSGLAMNPCWSWIQRMEICIGNNVITTLQGTQMFLMNQFTEWDEDRCQVNNSASNYSSLVQRQGMAALTNPVYYATLKTLFDADKIPMLNDAQYIQLRIYMSPLSDVATLTSGTITAFPINSVNALLKVTKLDTATAQSHLRDMSIHPYHHIFHDNTLFTYTVPSGVSTITTVLNGIVGNVAALYFVVRASSVGLGWTNYYQLASFSMADNTGTNIVGGQVLPASLCTILNKDWCKSSYYSENSFGTVDNKANFYCFAFSGDIVSALSQGQCLSSRKFTGGETLTLNFPTALGSAVQVDVYASIEAILEVGPASVKKLIM